MEIVAFLGPLIYFVLANASMVFLSKKSFGKCLPLTMMASSFTLFMGQVIFKTFYVGIIINILFAISSIGIYIWLKLKQDERLKEFKEKYITKGFITFVTIYILIFIFDLNKKFTLWDDFMHWGVMTKEMLRLDKFYSVAESTLLMHKDYPPIVSIFELFYIKIAGGYLEANAIRAIHLLGISLFIPAISEIKFEKNNIFKTMLMSIIGVFTIYQILLFWDNHEQAGIINSLYVDYLIGILFAYILFIIVTEKDITTKFSLINISISSAFLLLTKQISIVLYAFVLIGLSYKIFLKYKNELKDDKDKISKIIKIVLALVIIPVLLWRGWNIYIDNLNLKTDFIEEEQFKTSRIQLERLPGILKGTDGKLYQQETAKNFFKALVSKNIAPSYISLTFVIGVTLGMILLLGICIIGKKHINKIQMAWLFLTLIMGAIGYTFAMLVSYVFVFWEAEAPILASYDRYMVTYVIAIFSIATMLGFWLISKSKFKKENIKIIIPSVILAMLILILIPKNYASILTKYEYDEVLKDANYISSKTEELDTIYVVSENGTYETLYKIKYYANPRTTNRMYSSWVSWNIQEEKYWFNKYVSKFEYLYLQKINNEFVSRFGNMFDEVIEKRIYKINKENDTLKFELIEE